MSKSRKFISIVPNEKSCQRLQNLADKLGFDTTKTFSGNDCEKFNFHMTLLYTNEEVDVVNCEFPLSAPITVNCAVLMPLGDKATVLRTTNSWQINQIRQHYMKLYNVTHNFEDFIPHVSLSYVPNDGIEYPKNVWYFPVTFDRLRIEDGK